jgi:Flp pilus assembly protein TadD/predicted aspartyl protease
MRGRATLAAVLTLATLATVIARSDSGATADIQFQLGTLLAAEGRYRDAARAFKKAGRDVEPRLRLPIGSGLVLALLRSGEFTEARDEAEALVAALPSSAPVRSLLADAQWASGLFDEAERSYRDALSTSPEDARARHGLARALAARSRLDEAMIEAQAALTLSPRDGEFHYTVGAIYERMHRFEEAADALGGYLNLLPNRDRSEKAAWARAQIKFLKAFKGRQPFLIAGDAESMLHTLPFKLIRDKVVVSGKVNGGGAIDFVLDTGAEQTILSDVVARRAGITPITYVQSAGVGEVGLRGLQIGRINQLQFGTLSIRDVPCLIKNPPLGGLPTRETEAFSPLALGLSMVIDYERRTLTIGRKIVMTPEIELPLRLHRLAMVRGIVNSRPASFVIDTGGEVISISQSTAGSLQTDPAARKIPLKVYGTSGWDRDAFLLPNVDLEFASIRFNRIPVVVLNLKAPSALLGFELGGIVGHRFLSKYRVGIDLERSTLALTAN